MLSFSNLANRLQRALDLHNRTRYYCGISWKQTECVWVLWYCKLYKKTVCLIKTVRLVWPQSMVPYAWFRENEQMDKNQKVNKNECLGFLETILTCLKLWHVPFLFILILEPQIYHNICFWTIQPPCHFVSTARIEITNRYSTFFCDTYSRTSCHISMQLQFTWLE